MADLDCLGLVGKSISVGDLTNIKCSLTTLSESAGRKVALWGKVEGYHADYYVAQSLGPNGVIDVANRASWYSVDGGITWSALPVLADISDEQREFCAQIRGPYMGQPGYEYKVQKQLPPEEPAPAEEPVVDDAPAEESEAEADDEGEKEDGDADAPAGDEEDAEEKKPAVKRPKFRILAMRETVRLGYFVIEHDAACAVVPRGAYLRKDDGAVVRNRSFGGLTCSEATNIRNYFHCVEPNATSSKPQDNAALFGQHYNAAWDFLVSIVADMPVGVWTAKYDPLLNTAVLQNLFFAGSFFWHKPETAEVGQLYFGKGERNLDLCFVLP